MAEEDICARRNAKKQKQKR